ncbi:MAG TPA: hypothetical protein PKA37_14935 [Planctomycetota bacterium]|nr:hypothetical protein [Planctomycetota bacterium]
MVISTTSDASGSLPFEMHGRAGVTVDLVMQRQGQASGKETTLKFHGLGEEGKFWLYRRGRLVIAWSHKTAEGTLPNRVLHLEPGPYRIVVAHGTSVIERPFAVSAEGKDTIDIDVTP